ncbi:MAG: CPBP family intramembrane glutamic endopeptidase [Pseudomonadota bacterium]
MFAFLWAATAYCILIDRKVLFEGWQELWGWSKVRWPHLWPVLLRFVLLVPGMILFTWWYDADRLFFLPQQHPDIIWRIAVFYPLLSALPQEYIFCRFFFKRYKGFFGEGCLMVIMSAIIFALAHVLFINPVAPTLGFVAGLIFAHTYWKTKSLALVTIEHSLYGLAIFVIGLGWYFYSGSIG